MTKREETPTPSLAERLVSELGITPTRLGEILGDAFMSGVFVGQRIQQQPEKYEDVWAYQAEVTRQMAAYIQKTD